MSTPAEQPEPQVIHWGLDALSLVFSGRLPRDLPRQLLGTLRRDGPNTEVSLGGEFWILQRRQDRRYIRLRRGDTFLRISRRHRPTLLFSFHARDLAARGLAAVWESAANLAQRLHSQAGGIGFVEAKVSRVDMACDFLGVDFTDPEGEFCCRSRETVFSLEECPVQGLIRRKEQDASRRTTGWQWGRRDIVARVYDKARDLRRLRRKRWIRKHWAAALGRPVGVDEPVWRVEFQLRRQALRRVRVSGWSGESDIDSVAGLEAALRGLWEHLAKNCLTWRRPDGTPRRFRARWPLMQQWRCVQEAAGTFCAPPRLGYQVELRALTRDPSVNSLLVGLGGYLTSLYALLSRGEDTPTLEEALRNVGERLEGHWGEAEEFLRLVARKRQDWYGETTS